MFDEYERFQGVILRQIIVGAHKAVKVTPFERDGRVNAYVLDDLLGLFIKHSGKRMAPWSFTFHIEQASDLLDLEAAFPKSFVAFVCGNDGVVVLDVGTVHRLVTFEESESAWIRVNRKPRSMYEVHGNKSEMPNKLARGCDIIIDALKS
jgi:hypothetical protein